MGTTMRLLLLMSLACSLYALRLSMSTTSVVVKPPVTIIGAGPSGLSTAIMLARRGYTDIRVFERLDEPLKPDDPRWTDFSSERSYNIGLSGRGQKVLRALDVMSHIERYSADVIGRKDWSPESQSDQPREIIYKDKSYVTKVIQRDRLASILLHELREKEEYKSKVKVHFNMFCNKVDFVQSSSSKEKSCLLHMASPDSTEELIIESKFVLGCDGAASALRDAMAAASPKIVVKKFEDKNVRVYRTLPLRFPASRTKDWRSDLNYSARTKSDINIDALPVKNGAMLGVVLYRPWDTRISGLKTAADARRFFQEILPQFNDVIRDDDLQRFAEKGDSKLPRFSYTGPTLNYGPAALIGDAIHSVKPYFGLGLNSALEDVLSLSDSLEKHKDDVSKSFSEYSKRRGPEAKAIVQLSKRLDGGFLTFVLPLIIDNILHKRLPFLFSPNTLSSLQNENLSFKFIQFRKRVDRVMQFALLGSILAGAAKLAVFVFRSALRLRVNVVV